MSTKVTSGTPKASHQRTNRAALRLASMSRVPARCSGWLATMPDRPSVDAGEGGDERGRVAGPQLEEVAVVDHVGDQLAHVVGQVGAARHDAQRRGSTDGRRDRKPTRTGGSSETFGGQEREHVGDEGEGLVLVGRDEVGDAAAPGERRRRRRARPR